MTGGGPLVAFRLRGDKSATFRFMNALRLIKISNNLGDAKSLIAHPATTTHYRLTDAAKAELGITPGTVRLSVGLEHPDDLTADLGRALSQYRSLSREGAAMATFYTIGHSNRTIEAFIAPPSAGGRGACHRRADASPNRGSIRSSIRMRCPDPLRAAGIGYRHMPALGGLRPREEEAPARRRTASGTTRLSAITRIIPPHRSSARAWTSCGRWAATQVCTIFCAEADWRQCHRQIITDYLLAAGETVIHIMGEGKPEPARMAAAAVIGADGVITYPAAQGISCCESAASPVANRARSANVACHAGVAQPVEHQLPKLRVASSNLVARSNQINDLGYFIEEGYGSKAGFFMTMS